MSREIKGTTRYLSFSYDCNTNKYTESIMAQTSRGYVVLPGKYPINKKIKVTIHEQAC